MGSSNGKGGSVGRSASEGNLMDLATNITKEAQPLRQEVLGQTLEAMQTGGVGARLPIVQKGIEASRAGTSSAIQQLDESLARGGLGRSSVGDALRASTLLQGELATQAIPQAVATQMIGIAPTLTTGLTGQAMQGWGSATGAANQRAGISAQRDIAKGNQQVEYTKAITSMVGSMAMACWVAARLYGWYTPEWYAARFFLFTAWQGPVAQCVRWAYLRWGQRLAAHPRACEWLRPLFDVAVRRGQEALRAR